MTNNIKQIIRTTTSIKNGGSMFNKKTQCFTILTDKDKTIRLRGLVPAIREQFYPSFELLKIKSNTNTESPPIVGGVKKLLAAVGIGSILRSVTENEVIAPARATGMLINSNVKQAKQS